MPTQLKTPLPLRNPGPSIRGGDTDKKWNDPFRCQSADTLPLRDLLGSFSKTRRRRQRQGHQTKGLMSKTIAVHVRFQSLYISLPFSTNQQRELTKFYVFWRTRTAMANFEHLLSESNAFGACLVCASF